MALVRSRLAVCASEAVSGWSVSGVRRAHYATDNKDKKLLKAPVISIIDDDESVREATKSLVRSLGYNAVSFASAEEYLRSDCISDSACLITDMNMPGMSGADLQDRLIAEGQRVPMIFITAYFDEKVRVRVLNAGAIGFLRKPFDDEHLIECLNKALTEHDTEQ
jgi:FixJ family two-component response regulator